MYKAFRIPVLPQSPKPRLEAGATGPCGRLVQYLADKEVSFALEFANKQTATEAIQRLEIATQFPVPLQAPRVRFVHVQYINAVHGT